MKDENLAEKFCQAEGFDSLNGISWSYLMEDLYRRQCNDLEYDPERCCILKENLQSLSDDEKEVIRVVLGAEPALLYFVLNVLKLKLKQNNRGLTKNILELYFRQIHGWTKGRVHKAFKEIKKAVKF